MALSPPGPSSGVDADAAPANDRSALAGAATRERSDWSAASSPAGAEQGTCDTCAEETAADTKPGRVSSGLLADDRDDAAGARMRKSEFMTLLRERLCDTVDAGLAGTGRDSQGCPWIDHWLGYYENRSAAELERAIVKYAPEAAGAATAVDCIPFVVARVRRSVETWTRTGQLEGMPDDLSADAMPGGGVLGAFGGMFFKARGGGAREADVASVRERLGNGQALPGTVRTRMEYAFGTGLGDVRLHADANAAQLSQQLNARAFTLGTHVVFGAGEFQPGTLVGDALIAHEVAHVVQQGGSTAGPPQKKGDAQDGALEAEADDAAVGAVTALWAGQREMREVRGGAARATPPRLRASLRLQRCSGNAKKPVQAPNLQTDKVLRHSWEEAFQEGLALLNASVGQKGKDKGCAFPGDKPAEAWRYDKENWRQVTTGDEVRKYRVAFTPTKAPHVSVDELFSHLDRWECDCALFAELTWLYAWRHTLPEKDFDSRFANMRLRPQESTGLETETHVRDNFEFGLDSGDFEAMWAQAPVGTKVNWTNESEHARSPWRFENAVKSRKAAPGGQDLYDAHPMGSGLTEVQIKRGLAENSEDFPGKPFVVTDQTLADMSAASAPADFLAKLADLKDQRFIGRKAFSSALFDAAKVLLPMRAADPDRYQTLLKTLFIAAHVPATEDEKQAYVDKFIRRNEFQVPK